MGRNHIDTILLEHTHAFIHVKTAATENVTRSPFKWPMYRLGASGKKIYRSSGKKINRSSINIRTVWRIVGKELKLT